MTAFSMMGVAAQSDGTTETLEPGVISDDWLTLDRATGTWSEAEEHPDSWVAEVRPAAEPVSMAWGSQSETIAFGVDVSRGVQDAAEAMGVELNSLNNDFPDTAKPIEVAETVALTKPDLFINFNALVGIEPRVQQILADAAVPNLTITFPSPGVPVFGADNYTVGVLAGEYLADLVRENEWPQEEVYVVACDDLRLGAFIRARIDGFFFAMNRDTPLIPVENYTRLDCQDPEGSQRLMTDWLTANPQAKYIVMSVISDFRLIAMANALKAAGRDETAAGVGLGLDESAKEVIRAGDPKAFVGSVAFFPELYGRFATAMALDALEGKPIPRSVSPNHLVVDASNIDEIYPPAG
jgi:ABC-type sugar transport system substrate-binding protein